MSDLPTCNVTGQFNDFVQTSDPPLVNFTTNPNPPTSCTAPLTVDFTNNSEAGLSFEWDFGNGTTSTDENPPSVTYTDEGIYEVTLTGTNALGCAITQSGLVSVGPPVASFSIPDTVCVGSPLFVGNSSSPGSYQWDFGAGADPQTSTAFQPLVNFTEGGAATVSLTVTSLLGSCQSDTTKEIFVEALDLNVAADPITACELPLDIQLSAADIPGISYSWFFPDGSNTDEQNPVYSVPWVNQHPYYIEEDSSTYEFYLEVTTEAGCTFLENIVVKSFRPTAFFEVDVAAGCAPLAVTFLDSSLIQNDLVEWEWHFGDGNIETVTDNDPVTHIYQDDGDYEAFLVVTNAAGCKDTSYFLPILVGTQLMPDFTVDKTEVCPGDTVNFTSLINDPRIDAWHFESDHGRTWHCYQEDELSWSFVAEAGEPMDASLMVEYNGCFSTIEKQDLITVNGPIARLDYSMDCANPYDYIFADSSYDATGVTWFFGDSTQSNEPFITHTYLERDSFTVILEAENTNSGCPVSRDTAVIYVREIQAMFNLDTIQCAGVSAMLNGSLSQDVDANCHRGYTWLFSHARPITTQMNVTEHAFNGPDEDQWVALEVTDINGCRDTTYLDIIVYEVFANFDNDIDRICFPDTVSFTDLSTGDLPIVSWEWDFGDGETSMEQNPIHEYVNRPDEPDGSLSVTLTVMDSVGCPGVASTAIEYYTPVSTITADPDTSICVGETIVFSASDFTLGGSNLTWEWDFGNGETASGQEGSATYTQDGTFIVNLSFEEIATKCVSTTTQEITVESFPDAAFVSDFDIIPPPICYPQNSNFIDASISNYPIVSQVWDFGNGQVATGPSAAASFGKGTWEVSLIVSTDNGCQDTFMNSYTLVGPEGDFDLSETTICKEGEITVTLKDTVDISSYEWDFGDGVVISNVNPATHTYDESQTGDKTITLTLIGENVACDFNVEQTISIVTPDAEFTVTDPNSAVCLGEAFVFVNNSTLADTYEWDFGDGNSSTDINPNHTFPDIGTYNVILTAINTSLGDCSNTDTVQLQVFDSPQPMAEGTELCNGDSTTITIIGSAGSSFVWSPASLISGGIGIGPTVTTVPLTEDATISVTETTSDGCVGEVQLDIIIVPILPVEKDTFSTCLDEPTPLAVPANEFYTYNWDPTDGLSCTDCTETIFNAHCYHNHPCLP